MTYTVIFDVAAQADLTDLYDYLQPRAGARVAEAYLEALVQYCEAFSEFPKRGTRRDGLAPGLRTVGFRRRATIAFRIKDDVVTILRVFYGGRDVAFADEE